MFGSHSTKNNSLVMRSRCDDGVMSGTAGGETKIEQAVVVAGLLARMVLEQEAARPWFPVSDVEILTTAAIRCQRCGAWSVEPCWPAFSLGQEERRNQSG